MLAIFCFLLLIYIQLNLKTDVQRTSYYLVVLGFLLFTAISRANAAIERPAFKGYAPKLYILQPCDYKKDKTCDSRGFKLVERAALKLLYKIQQQQLNKGK